MRKTAASWHPTPPPCADQIPRLNFLKWRISSLGCVEVNSLRKKFSELVTAMLPKPGCGNRSMPKAKHLMTENFWCFGRRLPKAGRCLEIHSAAIIKRDIEM